jgi:hypothetical protein
MTGIETLKTKLLKPKQIKKRLNLETRNKADLEQP